MSLTVDAITVTRGAGAVLRNLDLTVGRGEMIALLGKNGAGKSTLLETIAGLLRPVAGHIELDGREISGLPADAVAREGVALVPEGRQLFPNMTVKDNLALGAHQRRWRWGGPGEDAFKAVWALFPDLLTFRDAKVRSLSGGQQQMVAVGRALMAEPSVLLLDEPTFGLSPHLTEMMCGRLIELQEEGFAIVLAEQNVDVAFEVAPRVCVLDDGHIVESGAPEDLADSPSFLAAMFGTIARTRDETELRPITGT